MAEDENGRSRGDFLEKTDPDVVASLGVGDDFNLPTDRLDPTGQHARQSVEARLVPTRRLVKDKALESP
jgi:hypothetical protein